MVGLGGSLLTLWTVPTALSQVITNDSYFYGQSPPVYPSPAGTGTGTWAAAYSQAAAFVAQLTIDEKSNLTYGAVDPTDGCVGYIPPISRLGFPGLCLQDAGDGVRVADFVNGYASGISVGASWNRNLAYNRGLHMGGEFKTKGVNIALGPVVAPLGRMVRDGRNWEGVSDDPYLCGALASETVTGMQDNGLTACTKHFIGYEQETNRNPGLNAENDTVQSVSSNIDDKTIHELYLWPFADAVRAGTGSVMCSYNRVNNSYACGNSKTLNGLLKTELGFQGFVVSDWGGQHGGYSTAEAGLDMAMPNSIYWGANLTTAIANGSFPESRLDDMATRIIATWYHLGQNSDYTANGIGMPKVPTSPHTRVIAKDPASKQTILDGAIEGHVLVKNTNGALPLKSPKLISLFGYSGKAPPTLSPGLSSWDGGDESINVTQYESLLPGVGSPFPLPQYAVLGTIVSGGGSGANSPAYISSPYEAFSERAWQDNTNIFWDFEDTDPLVDPDSDACIVFINAFATEGYDRAGIHDDYSDSIVLNVAANCSNTIVVIHNAGIRLVDVWEANPNVTAIIFAHTPGQDSGRAVASLIYGDTGPSGRLPYTVAKNESDYGNLYSPALPEGDFIYFPQSNFSEGVYIDYRAFDLHNITPRYEFGFGLSYTEFSYANLTISAVPDTYTGTYPTGPIEQGGHTDLWDVLYQVTADITNTGTVDGVEVAQLYVGIPGGPVKQLRGFSKVDIEPGTTTTVEFDLMRRDLSEWDVVAQNWNLQSGTYDVYVGASSRILPLTGTITI